MAECRAAFYARVSSEAQARDKTIVSQVAALRERIAADGVTMLPDAAYLDEGHSGSSLVRPALERLRDAVAAGDIDRVYVLAPDRLARRHAHQALLMEEFRRAGIEVAFLNRPIGASPEDDLLLQIQGVIAEYERAQILERGRRGRRHAARSGSVSALAGAPYGYRYITRERGGGVARFEIVPEEARFVRLIFAWVGLDRLSLREVCRRLQQAECRTRSGTTRWWASTLHGMIENPAYTGRAMYGRFHAVEPKPRLRPIRNHPAHSSRPTTRVPVPSEIADDNKRHAAETSLDYMGLKGGEKITDIAIDRVFIGSCTNGRIEDLRAAAKVAEGKTVRAGVNAMIVPGSGLVKEQAESEGLDKIFVKAGFEWREPGCSMCLAMNPDKLAPGERCASTSNRNFEGRQGYKGRTHLVSPAMAAAAAIAGHFVDVREWN